jgi:hypothetical protein
MLINHAVARINRESSLVHVLVELGLDTHVGDKSLQIYEKEIDKICQRYSALFVKIFHLLLCVNENRRVPPLDRIREYSVGILYLMQKGVMVGRCVLVPAVGELNGILPCPSTVSSVFKVRSKIITDTENNFKSVVRALQINSINY